MQIRIKLWWGLPQRIPGYFQLFSYEHTHGHINPIKPATPLFTTSFGLSSTNNQPLRSPSGTESNLHGMPIRNQRIGE